MKRIMTVDLENDLGSKNCESMYSVVPKLLDFFDNHGIKSTFFVVSNLLEKYESEIKEIAKKHEISSHSKTHSFLNSKNAVFEITESKKDFERYGFKIKGFRSPAFITTKDHTSLVKKAGYEYDASFARFFPKRYSRWSLPTKPYEVGEIVEFPMPNFVYPSVNAGLSYLKLLDPVSRVFTRPYMFYLHPWEFSEKLVKPSSFVGKMLHRNSGKKAWNIFESYVQRCNGKWVSCEQWLKSKKEKKNF